MARAPQSGFTLVEILISIMVLALLIMVGIPSFTTFIQNSRTRVAADGILNGLQTARNEAIRRNECVQLKVVNNTGWIMSTCRDPDTPLQSRSEDEGSKGIPSTLNPGGSDTVSFNGLGRVVNPNPSDGTAPLASVQIAGSDRPLNVVVPAGGGIRMCDPATTLSASDPRKC